MEFWVERGIQALKSDVKFRTTGCPELVFMGRHLSLSALTDMRHTDPSTFKSFDEWVPEYRAANRTLTGDVLTDVEDADGCQLLGNGYVADAVQRGVVISAILKTEGREDLMERTGLTEDILYSSRIEIYKAALWRRDEVLHSRSYGQAIVRQSFYVKCKYGPDECDESCPVFVGDVAFYALVRPVVESIDSVKVAICNLHRAKVMVPDEF